MRAYGLPRNDDVGNPDKADIRLYGLSVHDVKLNSKRKAAARRIWKKIERHRAKVEAASEVY